MKPKEKQPEPEKRKVGRPTDYKPEYNEQVYRLCLLGASDIEIAEFFGICEKTLNNWKNEYPEFLQSIKEGKEIADNKVAESLYKRANGFVKEDCEKVFQYQGEIVRATVREYYPPDTTAGIFWLKNRQPDKWRDKQEIKLDNNVIRVTLTGEVPKIEPTEPEGESA